MSKEREKTANTEELSVEKKEAEKTKKKTAENTKCATAGESKNEASGELKKRTVKEPKSEAGKETKKGTVKEPKNEAGKETKKETAEESQNQAVGERKKETVKELKNKANREPEEKAVRETKLESVKKDQEGAEQKSRSGGRIKWVVSGVVLALVLLLLAGYAGMAMYYKTHFLPGSSVNGIVCGNMTAEEIAKLVDRQIDTYCLQVWGRHHATGESNTLIGEVLPADISLSYVDSLGSAESLLAGQNEWSWLMAFAGRISNGYSLIQGVRFDEEKLKTAVNSWRVCQKENMLEPQNAYISDYNEAINGYEVIPETISTTLDMNKVIDCISNAIYGKQDAIDLERELCYLEAEVTREDAGLTDLVKKANTWLGARITYDWNGNEVILDTETLKEWITMEQDGPVLDEEAVRSFVKAQAKKYNTIGKKKKFMTALGIELTLDSPNYGWKTDTDAETEALIGLILEGAVTDREPAYSVTAKQKGTQDIGGDYVEADLTHQHLYVYQDGQIAFETDFVSGKTNVVPSCATPPGIFGLTYKTRNATLRGADYESFVNYWMPFFGNYGMHDATWRRDFGGTIFQDHGSHGCINLPLAAAEVIYDYVSTGFPVICYYYEVDPLGPPAESQMPSEEELLAQEEPSTWPGEEVGQGAGEVPAEGQGTGEVPEQGAEG